jgi:excisionase family DNA binding protein
MSTEKSPTTDLLTIDELSLRLRVSKSYIYKRTMAREIPYYRIGKRALFDPAEVDAWFRETTRRDVIR